MNLRKRINCLFGLHEPKTEVVKSYFSTQILTTCKHCNKFIGHSQAINYENLIYQHPEVDCKGNRVS